MTRSLKEKRLRRRKTGDWSESSELLNLMHALDILLAGLQGTEAKQKDKRQERLKAVTCLIGTTLDP